MHLIKLSKAKLVHCRFQVMKYFDQTCTSILSKCVKMYCSISSVLKSTIPYIHVICLKCVDLVPRLMHFGFYSILRSYSMIIIKLFMYHTIFKKIKNRSESINLCLQTFQSLIFLLIKAFPTSLK